MAPILKKYKAVLVDGATTNEYFFLANPSSYAGSLDTITGIQEAGENEQEEPTIKVGELLNSGKAFRVNVTYLIGTGIGTAKLTVAKGKLDTALDGLIGKPYRGGTITTAYIPTKATFF